ncbi:AMP-binding protein [Actinomadura madurae]|uniref:class I adenylate-forming enzyme family protein n=1 Tax=Actinomadura madurae TaxID=1993 RepID=UPI002025F25F|nr:AMP-binding protein [Actinomadura madurae]URN00873.1 AMP-binding protein [Actinomadura madurae]URN03022.1 AMP-binding protein [Actinomadura madurae]
MGKNFDPADACPVTTDAVLRRAAAVGPDLEAVVSPSGRRTYATLAAEVDRVRSALAAAGVRRGDHIAVCLGNGPEWITLFLAIGSLGAVTVPVNTRFQAGELAHALRQSRASMLFVADRFLKIDFIAMLRAVCPAVDSALPDPGMPDLRAVVVLGEDVPAAGRSWSDFLAHGTEPTEPSCTPDDVLLIQYTSGTTAYPKGVLLTHRGMCADAFFSGLRMGLRTGDRFHSVRPFFHVAGSTLSVLAALQHVATLVTMDRFEPGEALRLMETERCTHFSGNDTIALMLLGHPDLGQRTLALRGAWLAASPTIAQRVIDELGAAETVVGYGLSEASPNVAQSAWWEDREIRVSGRMLPQPGVTVRIRDRETGEDLPPGEVGEIQVRGWNVMLGYFGMPEETAETLAPDGWLSTGDLGRLGTDGRLEFCGRAKDVIRVGGENVSPTEVEDVLHRHPRVRQAAVVAVPDERLIEVPFAFVVLTKGGPVEAAEILSWMNGRLARFKVPRHLHILDGFEEIGMTASAKVRKSGLAEHAIGLLRSETVR